MAEIGAIDSGITDIRTVEAGVTDTATSQAGAAKIISSTDAPEGLQDCVNESFRAFLSDITGHSESNKFKGFLLKDFNDLQKLEIIEYLAVKIKKSGRKTLVLAPEITDIKNIYSGLF